MKQPRVHNGPEFTVKFSILYAGAQHPTNVKKVQLGFTALYLERNNINDLTCDSCMQAFQ